MKRRQQEGKARKMGHTMISVAQAARMLKEKKPVGVEEEGVGRKVPGQNKIL